MALPLEPQTDEMFPDTRVEPFILSDEVAEVAGEIVAQWDEFRALRDAIDSEAHPLRVAYVLDTKPFDVGEADWTIHTVVDTKKAAPVWRVLSEYDVVVIYRQVFWDAHTPDERLAFLHHGLSHIDALAGKVAIRPHPVEGFPWTFRRYGPLSINDRMFLRAGSLWTEDHPTEPTSLRPVVDQVMDAVEAAAARGEFDDPATGTTVTATRGTPEPVAAVCAEKFGPQRRLICTREPGHKGHHVDSEVRP